MLLIGIIGGRMCILRAFCFHWPCMAVRMLSFGMSRNNSFGGFFQCPEIEQSEHIRISLERGKTVRMSPVPFRIVHTWLIDSQLWTEVADWRTHAVQ